MPLLNNLMDLLRTALENLTLVFACLLVDGILEANIFVRLSFFLNKVQKKIVMVLIICLRRKN